MIGDILFVKGTVQRLFSRKSGDFLGIYFPILVILREIEDKFTNFWGDFVGILVLIRAGFGLIVGQAAMF